MGGGKEWSDFFCLREGGMGYLRHLQRSQKWGFRDRWGGKDRQSQGCLRSVQGHGVGDRFIWESIPVPGTEEQRGGGRREGHRGHAGNPFPVHK